MSADITNFVDLKNESYNFHTKGNPTKQYPATKTILFNEPIYVYTPDKPSTQKLYFFKLEKEKVINEKSGKLSNIGYFTNDSYSENISQTDFIDEKEYAIHYDDNVAFAMEVKKSSWTWRGGGKKSRKYRKKRPHTRRRKSRRNHRK